MLRSTNLVQHCDAATNIKGQRHSRGVGNERVDQAAEGKQGKAAGREAATAYDDPGRANPVVVSPEEPARRISFPAAAGHPWICCGLLLSSFLARRRT